MEKKEIYQRNLPHYHLKNQSYSITWMLASALPGTVLKNMQLKYDNLKSSHFELKKNKKEIQKTITRNYLKHFDENLHSIKTGNYFLRMPEIAHIVAESIHYWDTKRYDLIAYCIMPNHVHTVLTTYDKDEQGKSIYLQDILESIKKFSARECNKALNRRGKFWQHESFDRIIRDREDLYWTLSYVLENPIKAGFCMSWEEYKWNYIKPDFKNYLESE